VAYESETEDVEGLYVQAWGLQNEVLTSIHDIRTMQTKAGCFGQRKVQNKKEHRVGDL